MWMNDQQERENKRLAIVAIVCFLALFGAVLFMAGRAWAHDWYPISCCNLLDCYPMGDSAISIEQEPRVTPNGFVLHDGTIIAFRDVRPSPDGRYHVCRYGGSKAASMITAGGKPCFWAPVGAS